MSAPDDLTMSRIILLNYTEINGHSHTAEAMRKIMAKTEPLTEAQAAYALELALKTEDASHE